MTLPNLPPLPPATEPVLSRPLIARHRRRHLHVGRGQLTLLSLRRHPGWLAVGGLLFVLGALLAVVPWATYARDARIEREGTEAMAVVTRHETATDASGSVEHRVHYAFTLPDGTAQESEATVTLRGSESLALGNTIRVVYDPTHPSDGFPLGNGGGIDGGLRSVGAAAAFSGGGLSLAGLGTLLLWGLLVRGPGAWYRLLEEGSEAEGRVVQVEASGDRARLHYAFSDRLGVEQSGTTGWVPRAVSEGWAPGDPGIVRYGRRDDGRPDAAESIWLGRGSLAFFR